MSDLSPDIFFNLRSVSQIYEEIFVSETFVSVVGLLDFVIIFYFHWALVFIFLTHIAYLRAAAPAAGPGIKHQERQVFFSLALF